MVLSSIFGSDDRVKLTTPETAQFPATVTVRISATWDDGYAAFGSGAIVGRNDVLTAAHVIYAAGHGGLASKIVIHPGYENGSPHGSFTATDAVPFAQDWYATAPADDLAVLHTREMIGDQLGWVSAASTTTSLETAVSAIGYPADIESGKVMVRTTGTVDGIAAGLLQFGDDLDLAAGQSGSALLSTDGAALPNLRGVLLGYQYDSQQNRINLAREIDVAVKTWLDTATGQTTPWSFDPQLPAYTLSRYYLALFDRLPDAGGLNYWVQQAKGGMSLGAIAAAFVESPEFTSRHGRIDQLDTDPFVNLVYQQLLHRAPETAGLEYWKSLLDGGAQKSAILASIAQSPEAVANSNLALTGLHPNAHGEWIL